MTPPRDSYAEVGAAMRTVMATAASRTLPPRQYRVLLAILHETATWSRLTDTVSQARLGQLTGIDRRDLRRALHDLADAGLISYQPGHSRRGHRRVRSIVGLPPQGGDTTPLSPAGQGGDLTPLSDPGQGGDTTPLSLQGGGLAPRADARGVAQPPTGGCPHPPEPGGTPTPPPEEYREDPREDHRADGADDDDRQDVADQDPAGGDELPMRNRTGQTYSRTLAEWAIRHDHEPPDTENRSDVARWLIGVLHRELPADTPEQQRRGRNRAGVVIGDYLEYVTDQPMPSEGWALLGRHVKEAGSIATLESIRVAVESGAGLTPPHNADPLSLFHYATKVRNNPKERTT
ncbi:hypothetical protein [Euzebya sp.]|uniref:hypothetical protein n=1 Tax=Euzebya sp. TaxID=1971409 RepID=UPI003515D0A3